MRSTFEKRLLAVRATISADPARAVRVATELARTARNADEIVRARLTLGWAHFKAGRPEPLRATLRAGADPEPGALGHAEIGTYSAALALGDGDPVAALEHAARAVGFADQAMADAPTAPPRALAVLIPRIVLGTALIRRAIARYELGDRTGALADALDALPIIDPKLAPVAHVAAVTAAGQCLVRFHTPGAAASALKLARAALAEMRRRRMPIKSAHGARVKMLEAIALIKLGAHQRAKDILQKQLEILEDRGETDRHLARHLVTLLVEIGQRYRASGFAKKYQVETPAPPPEDHRPIGF